MRTTEFVTGTLVALSATGCKDNAPTAFGGQGSPAISKKKKNKLEVDEGLFPDDRGPLVDSKSETSKGGQPIQHR